MAIFRGIVHSLQIREDGWVETVIEAVHAGNSLLTFFIKNLDGDIHFVNKRLGQLSLLRDALSRVLPVEVDYEENEAEGRIITELMIHPRPSIDGRTEGHRVSGTVIGLSLAELGPLSSKSPYRDTPDLVGVTLLQDDGSLSYLFLDVQRTDTLTQHGMLAFLRKAHETRRPAVLLISSETKMVEEMGFSHSASKVSDYIMACEWITVPEEMLDYTYAFIERIGQRYESYDKTQASAVSHVRVVYTMAPAQTPEGDISENGSFRPETRESWIHGDSPLLSSLKMALKKQLQVKIGQHNEKIHEVEVVSALGSAARPVWVCVKQVYAEQKAEPECNNIPTIGLPTTDTLAKIPVKFIWKGKGYFNKGIWRFEMRSPSTYILKVDGRLPCCGASCEKQCLCRERSSTGYNHGKEKNENELVHVYLKGMHNVELTLYQYQCAQSFDLLVYRIR